MKSLAPLILSCLLVAGACKRRVPVIELPPEELHRETNSVYYWKTVFSLDSAEIDFMNAHDVERIYLRMFDVVDNPESYKIEEKTIPNATVQIDYYNYSEFRKNQNPRLEIVPVVFITLDALKAMKDNEKILAENIVSRVNNMRRYYDMPNVNELQLDCDWTVSTEESFFKLCKEVKDIIKVFDLPWKLSSTIRLHQLARKVPPVDRGVLMVYNTGSFNSPDTRNSILDIDDIKPYLKHLPSYSLHLDVAYPAYSWQLLFRNRVFIALTNGLNLSDTLKFKNSGESQYTALQDIPHNGKIIRAGDMVRPETSDFQEIQKVTTQINKCLAGKEFSNIIYHLDTDNLSKYTTDEIQNIYSTHN